MKNGNNVKDKSLTKKGFWQDYCACILEQGVPDWESDLTIDCNGVLSYSH